MIQTAVDGLKTTDLHETDLVYCGLCHLVQILSLTTVLLHLTKFASKYMNNLDLQS